MLKRGVTKQVVVKRALKRVTSQELSSDLIEILHLKTGLEDEKILKRHAAFLGLKIFCALQFLSIQIYMKPISIKEFVRPFVIFWLTSQRQKKSWAKPKCHPQSLEFKGLTRPPRNSSFKTN